MLSKEGVFIEVMDISNILNMGTDEVASIVGEIFGKDNPEGALEMISVLMNESKDR
jgi:hypothetical protein